MPDRWASSSCLATRTPVSSHLTSPLSTVNNSGQRRHGRLQPARPRGLGGELASQGGGWRRHPPAACALRHGLCHCRRRATKSRSQQRRRSRAPARNVSATGRLVSRGQQSQPGLVANRGNSLQGVPSRLLRKAQSNIQKRDRKGGGCGRRPTPLQAAAARRLPSCARVHRAAGEVSAQPNPIGRLASINPGPRSPSPP